LPSQSSVRVADHVALVHQRAEGMFANGMLWCVNASGAYTMRQYA